MLKKEHVAAKIFRDLTWHFAGKEDELFLTFDDGPTPEITPWILSVLKEYDAKATFFCIGGKVERFPELYNQIVDDGHSIGNHGYLHMNGWRTGTEKYVRNVERAACFINSNLFRPPYGRIRPKQISMLKQHFKIIMWDVISRDYDNDISGEECLENVLDYTESGSIIVFHDNLKAEKNLKYTLPKFLEHFTKQNYTFNSIESVDLV
ncbi:MAG: polysaccharide deacetylase family protein [Marinilabiliales bacterium]|nr:MAG: polysaccharide deacetylase family protein [Marinilabiliales bacterium]